MTKTKTILVAWLVSIPVAALAAEVASLEVTGALPKTGKVTVKELEAMKPEKATWTDHGAQREVEGVPLIKVLAAFGFESGPMGMGVAPAQKRPGYKKVVVVTAKDGFKAVFTCAELEIGATRALLVWKTDGKPLPADHAPFRLVVPTDKEGSRSPYAVERIEVIDPLAK